MMDIENIIGLILYLAPGFIALEIFRLCSPGKERNTFYHTTWSIIIGVVIYEIVKRFGSHLFVNHPQNVKGSFPPFEFIVALFSAGIIFGYILIAINKCRFGLSKRWSKLKWLEPDPKSIWAKINQDQNTNWAVVFLDDGAIYLGWIKKYRFDPNSENQDFLLTHAKRVDDDLKVKYIVDGIGVYLNTKDVKRIEFLEGN